MTIPDDVIEQVREAADLVTIIGEHVELKRQGSDFRGPCPFHGGKNRNFAVIPKKGMFYCFVCHEAGDVFTFYMKRLGMDYPTAVREVARKVGITIPERGPSGPDPREPLFSAVAVAQDWFARQLRELPEAEIARSYLQGRHVDLEGAGLFGLGYAPRGAAFLDAMKGLGVRDDVLLEAGLTRKKEEDGSVVPRFRGRLLFPIHDLRGRVVGFGGRILGEGEPKYLNSPDTPIFHKGKLLYHLDVAKHAMRKTERAILVEGYFDVLRLALAGVEEVVAPLGTGLSADQGLLLRRYTAHVILLYDSDEAGLRATFRAGDELLRHGLRVSVATLPEGEDPDTLVQRQGGAALEQTVKDAVDVFERKIQILERRAFFASLPGRRRALDRLLPTIRATADPVTRDFYITQTVDAASVSREALQRELEATGLESTRNTPAGAAEDIAQIHLPMSTERWWLLLFLECPVWQKRVLETLKPDGVQFPPYRAVFQALLTNSIQDLDLVPARTYEALRAQGLSPFTADEVYDYCAKQMEVERLESEMKQLDREIPLAVGAEQDRLVARKQHLWNELRIQNPRYKIAKRRSGAPGS